MSGSADSIATSPPSKEWVKSMPLPSSPSPKDLPNTPTTPKKLACHAGVAPFKKESGTSLRGPVHVSHLSNHTLKPLLTQAAWVAIRYTPNLRAYYQRLVEKGKKSQVALNNVKNKLIHIVIGLIRKDEDYTLSYCPVKKIYRII